MSKIKIFSPLDLGTKRLGYYPRCCQSFSAADVAGAFEVVVTGPVEHFHLPSPTDAFSEGGQKILLNMEKPDPTLNLVWYPLNHFCGFTMKLSSMTVQAQGSSLLEVIPSFGTQDRNDKCYHARVTVYSLPSLISTTGIVEGSAKPKIFYQEKRKLAGMNLARSEKFEEESIGYENERLPEEIENLLAENEKFAVATIVCAEGSSPRETGSKIIVLENGEIFGTIEGGCAERTVKDVAFMVLEGGKKPKIQS